MRVEREKETNASVVATTGYLKARPDQGPSLRHQRLGAHKQTVVVSSLDTRIGKGEFLVRI